MGSYPLGLAYSLLSDNGCVELLSKMAFDIFQAIEDNDKNTLELGMDCFRKVLNFICQGKPDLCFDERGSPKNFSLTHSIYLQVLRNSHVSRWPTHLFIFGFAYQSMLPLWADWLWEESKTSSTWGAMIQATFLKNLKYDEWQSFVDLPLMRAEFLNRTLAESFLRQMGPETQANSSLGRSESFNGPAAGSTVPPQGQQNHSHPTTTSLTEATHPNGSNAGPLSQDSPRNFSVESVADSAGEWLAYLLFVYAMATG
jgi:hypothetical protein